MSEPVDQKLFAVMTPPGAVVFWLSLVAIPLGIFTYSGPVLFLGAIGLVLLPASRWLAIRQMKKLRLTRRLPKRGFPGETFEVETELRNERTFLTSKELFLDDQLAGHGGSGIRFRAVAPDSCAAASYPAKVFQRGRLRISRYTLTSSWPFGFFRTTRHGRFEAMSGANDSILVAPKPVIPPFVDRILQQIEQEAALFSELSPDDITEFRSLREFRSGDSLQAIHWPASSRSDSIIVREFDPPLPKPRCHGIFLHQYAAPGKMYQPDRFEKMLRIACGLLVRFRQREFPVVVRIEFAEGRVFQIPEVHHYHEVLDTLAEAVNRPAPSSKHLGTGWEIFKDCDQVFVLGDCDRNAWKSKIRGLHPGIICLDPYSGIGKKRIARIINPKAKFLTTR
jgi:uncharacterized protein (DUF58 family)